jgi:hypothetical protein
MAALDAVPTSAHEPSFKLVPAGFNRLVCMGHVMTCCESRVEARGDTK